MIIWTPTSSSNLGRRELRDRQRESGPAVEAALGLLRGRVQEVALHMYTSAYMYIDIHIYMYTYMHHVCMYVCMYVYKYVCICICVYVCLHVFVYIHMRVCAMYVTLCCVPSRGMRLSESAPSPSGRRTRNTGLRGSEAAKSMQCTAIHRTPSHPPPQTMGP